MTKNFKKLIIDLQGTPSLISSFLENPLEICKKYKVSNEEQEALVSGNIDNLIKLGVSKGLAAGVLSGAHSGRCSTSDKYMRGGH